MSKIKIVAEASIPYLKGVVESMGDVSYLPSWEFTPEKVRDADWLIIRSITCCTEELLRDSRVQLITTATIGYDHIDTSYCERAGIVWHNAPGCNAEAVGQYFGSIIARLVVNDGFDPKGKVLGIVGVGHVGRIVKRYAEAFGMTCLLNDPPRAEREGHGAFVGLDEIAYRADVVTFHTPLTRGGAHPTHHLLGREFTHRVEHRPIIINACRGAVADTDALLEGLRDGRIDKVILDCWEGEPDISREMLEHTYIATPHIAGFSADGKANGARMCVEHGARHFGIDAPRMYEVMKPPPPEMPDIDLSQYVDKRVYRALLRAFDPARVEGQLRRMPEQFEQLRREYDYPREPHAYRYLNATAEEEQMLRLLLLH